MYFPRSEPATAVPGLTQAQAALDPATGKPGDAAVELPLPESEQLRNSYAGKLGHVIEPVIQPLGFDWKIGVALIASFAAREVLVSTLSIIYNVGKDENEESQTLISAIRNAKDDNGRIVWTPLTALTLMVFFVLAMQCMSTVAIVRRETNSWSWTLFMVGYMTGLAYLAAFVTYQGGRALGFE
jgi:ferrous iron transport protein B